MIGDKKKDNKGFSLLEMLVSVSVFVILILMVTSIFQNSMLVQKNAVATQEVQEGIRYALELMSKELRSSVTNLADPSDPASDSCDLILPPTLPTNRIFNYDAGQLYFRNKEGDCVNYYLGSDDRIHIERVLGGSVLDLPITPENVRVIDFNVVIEDNLINQLFANQQAKATLSFLLESETEDYATMNLQTTIVSRTYAN